MKKIKGLLFAFVALFAFTLAMVKVSAEVVFSYDADSDTNASYAKNAAVTLITGSDLATVSTVRTCTITATGAGTAVFDETTSFTRGMVPGGNCGTADTAALKVVSKVAGVKIGYYYTISDSSFGTSAEAVNSSNVVVMNSAGETLRAFDTVAGKNSEAYYLEYTINGANETILIGSPKRLITFALVVSQGEVSQEHKVTIMDGNAVLKEQNVVSGETLAFTPTKYGFDFEGYYTDSSLETPFDGNVSEDVTIYVKWTPWTITIKQNHLTPELISKVAASYTTFDESLALTGTIFTVMKGSQSEASSNSIKTVGGLTPKTEEKGIKIVAPEAGTLYVRTIAGGSTARNAKLVTYDGSTTTEIPVATGDPVFAEGQDKGDPRELTYRIEAAGTYYFGGSNGCKVFEMKFVGDTEPQVDFYQQSGYNADGTELVRYVTILRNVSEADVANFSLVITGEGLGEGFDVTDHCKVATRITSNGETYKAEINGAEYAFDGHDGAIYLICVVAVSNDGAALTDQYVGKELTATFTWGTDAPVVKTYTVLGAQQ